MFLVVSYELGIILSSHDQTISIVKYLHSILHQQFRPVLQGSKGIRQWLIGLCTSLMSNDDKQNFPFCRLKLVVETFGH